MIEVAGFRYACVSGTARTARWLAKVITLTHAVAIVAVVLRAGRCPDVVGTSANCVVLTTSPSRSFRRVILLVEHRINSPDNRTAAGSRDGAANTVTIHDVLDPIEEPPEAHSTDAEAVGGRETIDDWALASDLHAELATADADYLAGNTISGEQLRRRYGLT